MLKIKDSTNPTLQGMWCTCIMMIKKLIALLDKFINNIKNQENNNLFVKDVTLANICKTFEKVHTKNIFKKKTWN